jgi:putative ABC transporter-associated repeat protein
MPRVRGVQAARSRALAAAAALVLAALPSAALEPSEAPAATGATPAPTRVRADEPTATGRAVIADGHVDIGPRFLDGDWRIQVRDDSVRPSVWRTPSDVVLQAIGAARVTVPDERAFGFLGKPGARIWLLPQVQRQGVLWPGWNTQDPDVAARIRREASWTLHRVEGPGRFVLFENGAFGAPHVLFDSGRPLPQEIGIDADTHVHGNWAFTKPGGYRLDVEMSATTHDGERVSDRQVLRFFVGDGDARRVFAATAGVSAPGATQPDATAPSAASSTAGAQEQASSRSPLAAGALAAAVLALLLAGALAVRRRRRHA